MTTIHGTKMLFLVTTHIIQTSSSLQDLVVTVIHIFFEYYIAALGITLPCSNSLIPLSLICSFFKGIQQAPAIGRAISELIYDDDFQTIDLTRFCFDRMINNVKMAEAAIV